jgi:hypothetical protein
MAIDKKSIKKMFPNLYRELEDSDEGKVTINGVRVNPEEAEKAVDEEEEFPKPTVPADKLRHFNPSAVDFIRRCDTEAQAEEIINYLLSKGEIAADYAKELKNKLKKEGVRCFGPKKEDNYYFHEAGVC